MSGTSPVLNRRQALAGAALAFGAGVGGALAFPSAAAAQAPLGWAPTALTVDQARVLDLVAELIMPATDTPGARDAGVPQFIDRAVADFCPPAEAALIRTGLDQVDADARAAHGAAFAALKPEQQIAMLTRYDAEAAERGRRGPHFFSVLKEYATTGYFTSEIGATQALQYDPVPGGYTGCIPLSEVGRAWAT